MELSILLHVAVALSLEKQPLVPLHRRLGDPQCPCGHFWKTGKLLPLPGIEPNVAQPIAWSLITYCYLGFNNRYLFIAIELGV